MKPSVRLPPLRLLVGRSLLLALPFVLVGVGTRMLVPRWGDAIARAIYDVAGAPPPPHPDDRAAIEPAPPQNEAIDAGAESSGAAADAGIAQRAGAIVARALDAGPKDDGGPISIFVGAGAVDRVLAQQGKHLRGRTARDASGKPIGVRLTGVSAAGVGLQDGDLIVSVEGSPTLDDDVATDVLLAAIAHGKNVIHAKLLRGDRPIDLTLEVPLDAPLDGTVPDRDKASPGPKSEAGSDGGAPDSSVKDSSPKR